MTDLPIIPEAPTNPPKEGVVVLGRFQPLHYGHTKMIQAADSYRNENLPDSDIIISIGSANQPQNLRNPWTHIEREEMISTWLDSSGINRYKICSIPDIEDPPRWVKHAEKYHGISGVLFTSDLSTSELYVASGWDVVMMALSDRERLEGWRVRETARMLSTIQDEDAIREVLGSLMPISAIEYLISTGGLHRLAFMGEGGEPVG
tara:strand:+ start:11051 stop:11665 length:615 start_codon:yes stop_codon:yes gene_type:complete